MRLGDPEEVGRLIKAKRQEFGDTIEQFAARTGLSFITVHRLEHGRTGYIHTKTAQALEALEFSKKQLKQKKFVVKPQMVQATEPIVQKNEVAPADLISSGDAMMIGQDMPKLSLKQRFLIGLKKQIDKAMEASTNGKPGAA